MSADTTDQNEDEKTQASGKTGKGKAGSGGGAGNIRLPATKLKDVTANWEHLDAAKVVARLAEFFSELPARASAHLEVSWAIVKQGVAQGFTLVTDFVKLGQRIYELKLNPTRENKERLRLEYGIFIAG